jgi:O-antigen/teichoic acid export membrane protein
MRVVSPAKVVVLSAWGSRLVTASVSIYSLRVLSSALSPAEYATFIIIVGLSGWYALAGDLGIGYATQNLVTRKRALEEDPARDILIAYCLLAAATACVGLLTLALSGRVSVLLFAAQGRSNADAYASTLWWSGLIFTAAAAAGTSSKILYAVHRGYVSNILAALASIVGFVCLTTFLAKVEHKVLFAVCALYGVTMLFAVILAALQIRRSWHARNRISRADVVALWHSARWFLLFNGVAAAVLQVDYIIMSQKIASLEIVQYYNIAKLFAFSAFFNQAILFAIWPRFTEQYAAGQTTQVARTLRKLVLYSAALAMGTTAMVMLAAGPLGSVLSPSSPLKFRYTVIAGFGALALVRCVSDPYAIFLQSIGNIKPLIVFAAFQALISAGLQWILSGYLGIEGILTALVLSFLLTVVWGLPWMARTSLARHTG